MSNNLNDLTNILFDTLRGVQDGTVETEKAKNVTSIANAITANAKVQLDAHRLAGTTPPSNLSDGLTLQKVTDQATSYALSLGYDSVRSAIAQIGTEDFKTGLRKFKESRS